MIKRHREDDELATRDAAPAARTLHGVELGHEPPLNGSGLEAEDVDRRDVNLRWLGASVLIGLTGGALIGASIYIALQGATVIAQPPERARAGDAVNAARTSAARKGDKLVRQEMVVSAKHGFKAPVTIRTGDREVIRVRQFVRLATNLSLSAGAYATDIPPYNPLRLFAQDAGERYVEPTPETNDAEVSVVKRDLAAFAFDGASPGLADADVAALLEEERRMAAEAGRRPTVPIAPQLMLSRTLGQATPVSDVLGYAGITENPFNTIEVRVVPENVTNFAKADLRLAPSLIEDRDVILKRGETLDMALRGLGATPDEARAVGAALGPAARIAALPEGQRMRVLLGPGPRPGDRKGIVRVILFGERGIEAIAATNDRGLFVSVALPKEEAPKAGPANGEDAEEDDDEGGVRLYNSLYETAYKNELPRQTVEELVRIFGYDIDFQRRVASGDNFELFYSLEEETGPPEVLYAALTLNGETRRVYRFLGEDGALDYFDEAGRSLKKFLLRKPVADGIMRSGFGYRRHPILGYSKMHTGVDWANRIGTPIVASGNGTVLKAEWDGGYGRRIEIQHTNGYVTAYSHQSRFARGITPGARVRQGQVIGYVGNTGLSTGPHLHYEVMINTRFVDPMKIRLPRGRELDGRAITEFRRQRDEVDALLLRANQSTRISQQAELR